MLNVCFLKNVPLHLHLKAETESVKQYKQRQSQAFARRGISIPIDLAQWLLDALGIITGSKPPLAWSCCPLKWAHAFVFISGFMYHSVGFTCNCTSGVFSHDKDECSFLCHPSMICPIFSCHYQERVACIYYKYLKLEPTVTGACLSGEEA